MKYLTLFIMLIIAPFTFADNSIEKEDIKELVIMKDDKLFFYLDDGSIYKGDPKNPKHCPARFGRAHVWTPVTSRSRMPSSAWKKKQKTTQKKQ